MNTHDDRHVTPEQAAIIVKLDRARSLLHKYERERQLATQNYNYHLHKVTRLNRQLTKALCGNSEHRAIKRAIHL